jgi:hypothetical protein
LKNVKNMNIMKNVNCMEVAVAPNLSAEMILSTGYSMAPLEEAIGTVKDVLCKPHGQSKNIYGVIFRAKRRHSHQPDHLSVMNEVIVAARKSWHEMSKTSIRRRVGSSAKKTQALHVVDTNGIRFYRGCTSMDQVQNSFVPEEGIYLFLSHFHLDTVEGLGLEPLPKEVRELPLIARVGIENEPVEKGHSHEETDRESRTWREQFIERYGARSAPQVADEAGNTAKNRSAIASRWTDEKKIFGVRFQNRTLYPRFQFKDGEPIPAIAEILKEMPPSFTGWDLAFFFTSPNTYLDGKLPVELLKSKPERVVSLAHAFTHPADAF